MYQFDGSPMNPMYLAYSPTPQMLPTQTLNPTTAASSGSPATSATGSSKRKRAMAGDSVRPSSRSRLLDPDLWWWLGVVSTGLGAVLYFAF